MSHPLGKIQIVRRTKFKRILRGDLAIFLLMISIGLQGQINPCAVGVSEHLRNAGFMIDLLPDQIDLGEKGDLNLWLFQNLQSVTYVEYQLRHAKEGRYSQDYPEADYVQFGPQNEEVYFTQNQGRWHQIAVIQPENENNLPVRRNFMIPLQACLPGPDSRIIVYSTTFEVDSEEDEKVSLRMTYSDERDASGKLYLPQGIYDAYRIERKVTFTSQIEDAVESTGYEDYTSYLFVDKTTQELILEVRLELDGTIDWVKYRSTDEGAIPASTTGKNQFALYPSPSFGDNIRLDFRNFKEGKYNFYVYNVFGKMLWSQQYDILGDVTIKADLSFLPKGTYTYRLQDINRNTIVARRLAIINP